MPFILLQSKQHSVAITILKIYGYALGSHFLYKVHKHTNYNHMRKGKDTIILARFDSFFNNSIGGSKGKDTKEKVICKNYVIITIIVISTQYIPKSEKTLGQ